MRRLAIAMLFGLAGIVSAQDTPARITYTSRAARAERVVAELAQATKMPLVVAPTMANEVLVVSAQDVPVNDLLQRIATATSGEWRSEGGVIRLAPAVSVRNQEELQERNARLAAARKSIASRVKAAREAKQKENQSKPAKPPKKAGEDEEAPDFQLPANPADELLAYVDVSTIAELGEGGRVVFSSAPTRMQRAFTGDISEIVTRVVAKHNESVQEKPNQDDPEMQKLPQFIRDMANRFSKPINGVGKALLVVSKNSFGMFAMTQVELRVYDTNGRLGLSEQTTLDFPSERLAALAEMSSAVQKPGKTPPPAPTTQTPIELSPDTVKFQATFGGLGMKFSTLKIDANFRPKLFRPDLTDPLSFLATDEILSLAKKRGRPVVALVPDDAETMFDTVGNKKPTLESFEQDLKKGAVFQAVPDEVWLVLKPTHPAEARAERLDRKALATLLGAAQEKGIASLEDVAEYSLHAPSPMSQGLAQIYTLMLAPGAFEQGLNGMTNWEMMRLYGSFDPTLRKTLVNGGRIPLGTLNPYQQTQVRKMVYGANSSLTFEEPGKKPDDTPEIFKMFGGFGGGDYRSEPTEALPNGVPGDGVIEIKGTIEPIAVPSAGENEMMPGVLGVLDADMLGMFRMIKSDANMAAIAGVMPSFDRLRVGERTSLTFNFRFAPQLSMHHTLHDNRVNKNASVVSMSALPDSFQKAIADRAEALKKSPLGAIGAMMGMGGKGTIKP